MNPLDIVLGIGLAVGLIQGYRKGLLMEVVSILALIAGILGALKFMDFAVSFLASYIDVSASFIPILVFIILFFGIIWGVYLVGKGLKKIVHLTPLGLFDSFIGAAIGLLKWAFAFSVFLWIINFADLEVVNNYTKSSLITPYVEPIAPEAISLFNDYLPFISRFINEMTT